MKKAEDTLVVPMGAKWDIANTTKQTLRLALSLSPSR
jgi:hypothetical protein